MAKKSLLLVDADSKSLRMLEVSLRKAGFSVTTAVHADDAREKLAHNSPDLIISDTKLPGGESGFAFVGKLKKAPETASIPIIFLSSETALEQKVAGLELGVEDYLTKPIYMKEVLTRVRVLLDKREKQTLERRERTSSFSGLLGDMGLVDLMQTVENGRKTGRLLVENRGLRGHVSFREGKVCDAKIRRLTGERAFYRILVWNEGAFSMDFGPHDDADVIELSTQGLLMEGMRRVDEWGRLLEQLPPLEHRFEVDSGELVERLSEVPDEVNALLRLIDGRRTLLEVLDETDFGDLEALEIASKLYFEGLIVDVTDRDPPTEPVEAAARVEPWPLESAVSFGFLDDDNDGVLEPNDTMPPTPAVAATLAATDADTTSASRSELSSDSRATIPELSLPPGAPALDDVVESMFAEAIPTIPGRPSTRLPTRLPTTVPTSGPTSGPTTTASASAPEPARPLPASGGDTLEPENRSVLPRSAVGATAWSSRKALPAVVDDHAGWEDIAAADVSFGQPLPHIVKAALAEPAADLPVLAPAPAATALAHELVHSEDELALAIREADPSFASGPLPVLTSTPSSEEPAAAPHALSVPVVAQAAATETDTLAASAAHEDLARRIAAQLDDTSEPHGQGPSATSADDSIAPISGPEDLAKPPTSTSTAPTAPKAGSAPRDDGSIHTERTALDLEPLPPIDRFGIRPAVAIALFIVSFLGFIAVVMSWRSCEAAHHTESAAIDQAVVEKPAPMEAPPVSPEPTPPTPEPAPPEPPTPAPPPPAPLEPVGDVERAPDPTTDESAARRATMPSTSVPEETADGDAGRYARQLKLGDALSARAEHMRSIKAYKAALAINPSGVAAHLGLGNAYYEIDALDAALVHLEKARALSPADPQVYVLLGAAYQSANRTADAVDAYERYLQLAPSGRFARDVRGILKRLSR